MLGLSFEGELLLLELELLPPVGRVCLLHVWLSIHGLCHRDVAHVTLRCVHWLTDG